MTSLATLNLNVKSSYAFANGVFKRTFQNDATITPEFLHEHLFAELKQGQEAVQEVAQLMDDLAKVQRHAASQAWGVAEYQEYLANTVGIANEEVIAGFVRAWKADHANAHDALVSETVWNSTYKGISWRVDLLSSGKNAPQTQVSPDGGSQTQQSEPVALVQLQSTTPNGEPQSTLIELSTADVANIVSQLNKIQAALDRHV